MTGSARRLELRAPVLCTDGEWGELRDLVIEPVGRCVTHLVVEPDRAPGRARMVPIALARQLPDDAEIRLACSLTEADRHPAVGELGYLHASQLPNDDPDWDVGVHDVLAVPGYDNGAFVEYGPQPDPDIMVTYDRVPKGTVEIRHSSIVTTVDGHGAGRPEGFLVDEGRITHLVLHLGHLWARREVNVPIEAVADVRTDELTIRLSKDELAGLPSLPLPHRRRDRRA